MRMKFMGFKDVWMDGVERQPTKEELMMEPELQPLPLLPLTAPPWNVINDFHL